MKNLFRGKKKIWGGKNKEKRGNKIYEYNR